MQGCASLAPQTPRALADDIRASCGGWALYGARFVRSFADDATHRPGTWVTISGPSCCAEVELSARSPIQARRVRAALRRAGYYVGALQEKPWLFARRPLRGHKELVREARHLEAIALDPDAFEHLPKRASRPLALPPGAFPVAALEYLLGLASWTWSWAAAERRGRPAFLLDAPGWSALAWCSILIEPGDAPYLDLGAQVFPSDRDAAIDPKTLRRLKSALAALLRPRGYRPIHFRSKRGARPTAFWMGKRVDTLSSARIARKQLGRLIVSD